MFDEDALGEALSYCGYYPLLTNMSDDKLSIEDAMMAHKNQYKSEHLNRRGAIPFSGTINDSPSISSNIKY
jgi:hypothetical protein